VIQIQWTCGTIEEASEVAKALVEKRLVGCANIIPHVESIYLWEGKLRQDQEVKVLFKTIESNFEKVKDYILAHASYEVPEISQVQISDANPEYEEWLVQSLKNEG